MAGRRGGLDNSIWCTPGILAPATVIRCRHLVVVKLLFSMLRSVEQDVCGGVEHDFAQRGRRLNMTSDGRRLRS